MLLVALNVGPWFFSFVPSLNDDVRKPFALKTILLFLLKKTCISHIDMLKMHLSMEKMELMYVGSIYRLNKE